MLPSSRLVSHLARGAVDGSDRCMLSALAMLSVVIVTGL